MKETCEVKERSSEQIKKLENAFSVMETVITKMTVTPIAGRAIAEVNAATVELRILREEIFGPVKIEQGE